MADLLVDTDILVDHLRTGSGFEPGDSQVWYSVVTRAELFAGRASDESIVERLLEALSELPVDRSVGALGGQVRREAGLALPDALIAATALRHGLTLLTRNRRRFERVADLKLAES